MITKLESELLEVSSVKNGAQLTSIKGKKDGIEYLWNANPKYWNRHAPILFPIVGKVKDNKYRIGEKEYTLGQHGFARDNEFQIVENSNNKIVYRLTSSEETLKNYPYNFLLDVEYFLSGNILKITYKVRNTDIKKIFFSIGAHPGFNCPLSASEIMEDYYLEFNETETAYREFLDAGTGLLNGVFGLVLDQENILNLSEDLFKDDALIFKGLKSNEIALKSYKNNKKLTMNFEGFPYMGIWSKPGGAPFICIEPWLGHADSIDFNGDFREKPGIIGLETDKEFICTYSIAIEQ